jgi:hypothetical protein
MLSDKDNKISNLIKVFHISTGCWKNALWKPVENSENFKKEKFSTGFPQPPVENNFFRMNGIDGFSTFPQPLLLLYINKCIKIRISKRRKLKNKI